MRGKTPIQKSTAQSGFTAVEALGGLLVILLLLPLLASLMETGVESIKKRAVADHLAQVVDAASEYSKAHWSTLTNSSTATTATPISMAQLAPFLPAGFGSTNPWGQGYAAYALEPFAGELQVLVLTTGGRGSGEPASFLNSEVPSTASLIGGAGGFIPTGTMPGQPAGSLRGVYGGWSVNLTATTIPNPGPGHLGAMVSLREGDLGKDFLYRVSVPGHPELNEMATELDMTDHTITGIRSVQFESHTLANIDTTGFCGGADKEGRVFFDPQHGLYICRNGEPEILTDSGNSLLASNSTIAANNDLIPKPTCPPGISAAPRIFVTPTLFESGSSASSIVSAQAWASDEGANWRVHLRLLTTDSSLGWVEPNSDHGRVMVITTCN